jgi:putative flippase GtrA
MTDWDAELKKIDKQLESMSDSALIPAAKPAPVDARAGAAPAAPAARAARAAPADVTTKRESTRTWGAFLRLALATALGVGIVFWPYPKLCGLPLAAYLAAVVAVVAGGLWSSVWTWKHRTSRAHVLSLLLVIWGLVLGAIETLPRVGYAKPDATRPPGFACTASPAVPSIGK